MNELIAARVRSGDICYLDEAHILQIFAGIGGGGMTTVVSILMSDICTLRERGVWQGVINIIYASGAGCGAPLGMFEASTVRSTQC